ncbi:TetR family transcriptional regulator [Pseudonocardia hierapolitana]|uniref:TetR family transcriptional regulator n=1 Tax=Pseudonocardia hierapolitana TaxID=1128676 RepID=A0A561SM77_9PSEU|nr:TetR/AcrR family transcriptional regulator [Pseudonocardia hierapolitana]TWF75975.1 TetR family transcriptional regulator [Pseudonocardia hierapolitana]
MSSAPRRADARRNRARLLETAHALFAERGTDASLEEVARRAGVAIGTLYRHFPTREDLLAGLFERSLQELADEADALLAEPVGVEDVLGWLRLFASHSGTYRGLPRSVLVGLDEEGSPLHASCTRMQGGAARLFAAARAAGSIRADVSTEDVLAIVAGIAWVVEQVGGDGRADRLLGLVRDALAAVR